MPLPTLSFLFGVVVLGYLTTFVVFAFLRIITGVSIQRIGYSGLRRIAYSPRPGIRFTIRGIGLRFHRPTFAVPTWCSLVIEEPVVCIDLQELSQSPSQPNGFSNETPDATPESAKEYSRRSSDSAEDRQGKLWQQLKSVKEKIKRLHKQIQYLRLVDFVATAATLDIVDVGTLRLERTMLSVDTRKQTVDRSRLFQHHKHSPNTQTPAEWKCLIRSVWFTPEGRDATEILDFCTFDIHGMLHRERDGLHDASIALKLGRLRVPFDDIEHVKRCADLARGKCDYPVKYDNSPEPGGSQPMQADESGSRNQRIVQSVSESREFVSSLLRSIQEIQFAIGFVGLSKKLEMTNDAHRDVYFNFSMKEFGVDLLRLDPKSPAHKMYFCAEDVAHQALLTGISISAGIDDGHEHPERMVYVPMVTATVKTTLPSRTVQYATDDTSSDRNTNILYATFVCTSPSIDFDPKHFPLFRALRKKREKSRARSQNTGRHQLISQLLPKAHVKFSIQEPVFRISLPPMNQKHAAPDDFDLLICSVSSIALECESSHDAKDQLHYTLNSYYRHSRHRLYYHTAAGERHDLLYSDFFELHVDVNALPDISVKANGRLQTFSLFLVRPDICKGIQQILSGMRKNSPARARTDSKPKASFLRKMPDWLHSLQLEGSDFSLEIAGVDEQVSHDTRGFALHLDSWSTEYKTQHPEPMELSVRRKSITKQLSARGSTLKVPEPAAPRKRIRNFADGRRLAFHIQNLEGLMVDSIAHSDPEQFLSLPRFEVAFSTSTDGPDPIFHINALAKSILLHYSLYNHLVMGMAVMVIRNTFMEPRPTPKDVKQPSLAVPGSDSALDDIAKREITVIDFKTNLVQVKATLPDDPPMMLQIFNLECGRHHYTAPFVRSRLARLYVRNPRTKAVWSRIVTLKVFRVDLRDLRRKVGKQVIAEKSIDMVAETIRFAVPHGFVMHSVFDNIANVIKTTKQLQHHFVTGNMDYILAKSPEGPKRVPRINIRTQLFLLDLEDSHFEWNLGCIYRAGLQEQKQRLAREDAFNLKLKRMAQHARRESSQPRARSANPERRSRVHHRKSSDDARRSKSAQPGSEIDSESHHHRRHSRRKMRYDADGECGISDTSHISVEKATEKLHLLNSQSWKNRIDRVMNFQTNTIREMRTMIWGMDELPEEAEQHEPILALSQRPGVLVLAFSDLNVTIDKPSFPLDEYPNFIHDVGKGMPKDMKYGLLVPMNLHITTSEARIQLRDYPIPLLHIPALSGGQSHKLPALSIRTDFVVAEEFRDFESQRQTDVEIIPPRKMNDPKGKGFFINVRRTISAVKTYSDIKMEINTSNPTKFTWSTSYQPAIQDAMLVLEGFTKPPIDPSDKPGVWDKVRMSLHSRVNIAWKGDGDMHLVLKGSRDPYVVTGHGAGLVMVWRDNVSWNIAQDKDPRRFIAVESGEYLLAVPDFNSYAQYSHDNDDNNNDDARSSYSSSSQKRDARFQKVIMKLSGRVTWLAGLMFERETSDGGRSFEFKPHYDVVLKHPDFAKAPDEEVYDAYRGFRSEHIHMSVAVIAPRDRDWSVSNVEPSKNYNSVHLTPRFFSHFFSWWSMFSGVMSLPIRQGPLWGVTQKKSKKFGRHLATIKYNLLLSPLYISHVYKHKDAEDYEANSVQVTGLKMRIDSFMVDLHQRREHFDLKGGEGFRSKKSSGMKINQAQLDFISADLRALSATIEGTNADEIERSNDAALASMHGQIPAVDISNFVIPDNDLTWIDMDDFVELDWILPAKADPETKILPLAYAPRFTYFRQTDHNGIISGDPSRTSPFGDEPTHHCVMSAQNDPRRVQVELIQERLHILSERKSESVRTIGELELKSLRGKFDDDEARETFDAKLQSERKNQENLSVKYDFLQSMLNDLNQRLQDDDGTAVSSLETSDEFTNSHKNARRLDDDMANLDSKPMAESTSDFNNRFIVHNAQVKWNNSLRNIILRYFHQNSQRRGFVYYMSRKAVKFIINVLEERRAAAEDSATPMRQPSQSTDYSQFSPDVDDETTIQDRIEQLLKDGRNFVNAEEPYAEHLNSNDQGDGPQDDIAVEFAPLNVYHFRLIAPQIQLQSDKNNKSAVLVAAKGMHLKVVEIMEKDKMDDDVSGLVQRRFSAVADSLQVFHTSIKSFSGASLHLYSANRYGAKAGTYWPPWVPMEIMFEFESNPYGFSRVVHRTSTSLRYDKFNTLRLKYNDDVTGGEPRTPESAEEAESRMDHVWVEFPHFRAICDSNSYFSLYIIVMDLLLYNEPLGKTRSERLEKIMLASDFSDLTGAPEMVQMLQERIRQLEEIKLQFQVHERYLDRQGWKDQIAVDQDLASCEDELFFMMKAITTSQQRVEDRREQENALGLLHLHVASREIAWHLIRDGDESLMEFQLKNASFDRTDNNDGSNYNCMEIGRINGFNLLPDALYPEVIAPFEDESRGGRQLGNTKMLRIQWLMQEAIAGIPVVDYFEIDIVPLKLQIEKDVAKKLFEYIFPGKGEQDSENQAGAGSSPFIVKNRVAIDDNDDEDITRVASVARVADKAADENKRERISELNDKPGPGSLENRLKPTMHLTKRKKARPESKGLGISHSGTSFPSLSIFHSDKSRGGSSGRSLASKQALAQANLSSMTRSPSDRSLTTLRSEAGSAEGRRVKIKGSQEDEKKKKKDKTAEQSDDLTQMMDRASNYMTLAFIKIPSVVLCLSYKGHGKRNIEDVRDLVFRMATLEYRNKTWSNLDLTLQLKKDVIKALISHAGAIVSNKFSHHKPNWQQQSRLRELVNRSTFMSPASSVAALPAPADDRPDSSQDSLSLLSVDQNGGRPVSAKPRSSLSLSQTLSHDSTNSSSASADFKKSMLGINGDSHSNGHRPHSPQWKLESPPQHRVGEDIDASRPRTATLHRHLSTFTDRRRPRTSTNGTVTSGATTTGLAPPAEESEEVNIKSKLLLGGQKLFGKFRDP